MEKKQSNNKKNINNKSKQKDLKKRNSKKVTSKSTNNKLTTKKKEDNTNSHSEDVKIVSEQVKRKKQKKKKDVLVYILIGISFLLVVNVIMLVDYNNKMEQAKKKLKEEQTKIKELEKQKELEQQQRLENIKYGDIVFLGDSITDFYELDKFYDIPIVNSGISGWTTDDILENLEDKVFKYDVKKIFLLIGTNDIIYDKDEEYITDNIIEIVNQIKKKTPDTKIYIDSIYPVNDTENDKIDHYMVRGRKNDMIVGINKKIRSYCKNNEITYINMYDLLKDDEGNLNIDYTADGLHMSSEGYEVITKKRLEYIKR